MKSEVKQAKLCIQIEKDLTANRVKGLVDEAKRMVGQIDNYREISVDLSRVQHIDSTGISFIIGLYKSACSNSKAFKLTGLNEDIFGLFRLMKLDKILEIETA
ncbi:STAS domain-containing protein [Heliobacterium chlorum]|uniref:STAS domain-containing protein n=1 Tax=Heliobacterium chlorum TaxID=2698 RepID=A0ABR7T014_HELCL|nr:STAS domain-containing protein [Heliobacterium chlorum]